jgi:hypothetical protein
MPIDQSTVQAGWLYKTPNNQERVVLGCNADCKVVYASRGGNVQNAFDHREASSLKRFAEACSERVRQLSSDELQSIIQLCNASSVIVPGETCCFAGN